MCNLCICERINNCSIMGYANSLGFCCSECVNYDEMHACLKEKYNVRQIEPKVIELHQKWEVLGNDV